MGAASAGVVELDWAQGELFEGRDLPAIERGRLIARLLETRIRSGRGAGYFDPGSRTIRLFTGETVRTRLAAVHIYSQESARMLHRMAGDDPAVRAAIQTVSQRLRETCYASQLCTVGECAVSFVGYLRFLHAVEGDHAAPELAWRLQTLSQHRSPSGRWTRLPFYYTVLTLLELGGPVARAELAFAQPACSRAARLPAADSVIAERRARILAEALAVGQAPA